MPGDPSELDPLSYCLPGRRPRRHSHFYGTILGCPKGRSSAQWIDFDLFGHQIVAHLKPSTNGKAHHNPIDGHDVPVPHFGMFFLDPAGDALEFKAFADIGQLFAK